MAIDLPIDAALGIALIVLTSKVKPLTGISDSVNVLPLSVYALFVWSIPFKLTIMLFALAGTTDNVKVFEEPVVINVSRLIAVIEAVVVVPPPPVPVFAFAKAELAIPNAWLAWLYANVAVADEPELAAANAAFACENAP